MKYGTAILAFSAWLAATLTAAEPIELVQKIALPGRPGKLDHFGFDAVGGRLFVSNQGNSSLDVLDAKTGSLLKQVPELRAIHGIAYHPELQRIFVGVGDPGQCAVLDGRSYEILKRIPILKADNVQFDPHSKHIFVGHTAVTVIDPKTMTIERTIATPGPLKAFRIDTERPRLVANATTGEVIVIDTMTLETIATHTLKDAGGKASLAIDAKRRRVFVGCRAEPRLIVLNADSGAEVARYEIPPGIDDLSYDAERQRLYASCGDGAIAIFEQSDADHYSRLATQTTARGARTSFFDPGSGRLYLGVPGSVDAPTAVWIYAARP